MSISEKYGIPIDKITWEEHAGNPFGAGMRFNGIVFKNLTNIVDVEGALAVGGNFTSVRGCSVGYGVKGDLSTVELSAENARLLIGGNAQLDGALTVGGGHCVIGGNMSANRASGYLIGKRPGASRQRQQLSTLYKASNGSPEWAPTDEDTYFVISCYDTSRYIPAKRINADLESFFADGYSSIKQWAHKLQRYPTNGTVAASGNTITLTGRDPKINIFMVDLTGKDRLINDILLDTPASSTNIVNIAAPTKLTISNSHIGTKDYASQTIFNLLGPRNIEFKSSSDIYGSFLAPMAKLYIPVSGGSINGNVAIESLDVDGSSGFELHLAPFQGDAAYQDQPATPSPSVEEILRGTESLFNKNLSRSYGGRGSARGAQSPMQSPAESVDMYSNIKPPAAQPVEDANTTPRTTPVPAPAQSLNSRRSPLQSPTQTPTQPSVQSTGQPFTLPSVQSTMQSPVQTAQPICSNAVICGRVNVRRGGFPVSDVDVKLYATSSSEKRLVKSTSTDRFGRYSFAELESGSYMACVETKMFGTAPRCSKEITTGCNTKHEVNIIL